MMMTIVIKIGKNDNNITTTKKKLKKYKILKKEMIIYIYSCDDPYKFFNVKKKIVMGMKHLEQKFSCTRWK